MYCLSKQAAFANVNEPTFDFKVDQKHILIYIINWYANLRMRVGFQETHFGYNE